MHALQNFMPTKREMAQQAIHIEQNIIGEHVGSQDQTAAAFGGLNKINFNGIRNIDVEPIIISKERTSQLQNNLMLFFTGFARTASTIAKKQIEVSSQKENELNTMIRICEEGLSRLTDTKQSIDEFGKLLDEQWKIKRGLTNMISNKQIDSIYDAGIDAGALGGKLLGAGGGGFMLFYVPKDRQKRVREALKSKLFVPFQFDYTGSKIIYHSHEDE
jgi:D-glycero-alpha-D-manno-heptose-7-phosphate kinase